jgi:hypothetical protein
VLQWARCEPLSSRVVVALPVSFCETILPYLLINLYSGATYIIQPQRQSDLRAWCLCINSSSVEGIDLLAVSLSETYFFQSDYPSTSVCGPLRTGVDRYGAQNRRRLSVKFYSLRFPFDFRRRESNVERSSIHLFGADIDDGMASSSTRRPPGQDTRGGGCLLPQAVCCVAAFFHVRHTVPSAAARAATAATNLLSVIASFDKDLLLSTTARRARLQTPMLQQHAGQPKNKRTKTSNDTPLNS